MTRLRHAGVVCRLWRHIVVHRLQYGHISPSQETHPGLRPSIQLLPDIQPLSLISKIIERVVKSNNLLNPHQSAYCKHHSTETALALVAYIHDHLINAIRSQQISCLCLLDLSASFDTID